MSVNVFSRRSLQTAACLVTLRPTKAAICQRWTWRTRKNCLESNFISNSINSQVAPFIIIFHKSIPTPSSSLNVCLSQFQHGFKSFGGLKQLCGLCSWGGTEVPESGKETLAQNNCPTRLWPHEPKHLDKCKRLTQWRVCSQTGQVPSAGLLKVSPGK